jgi:flagellar biosynthesis GTPase FlhF
VTDPSSPSSAPSDDSDGVRTYRGRTIEELIPRIRAELGPDAIILREREGLMGGIGGFFAQKCVEIDAQAAPRVNVYADDFEDEYHDDDFGGAPQDFDEFSAEPPPGYVPVPLPDAPPPDYDAPQTPAVEGPPASAPSPAPAAEELQAPRQPVADAPPASQPAAPPTPLAAEPPIPVPPASEAGATGIVPPAPAPPVSEMPAVVPPAPEPPAAPPRAPAAPFLDEASFAARLEEASFETDARLAEPEPDPEPAPRAVAPSFIAFDELDDTPVPAADWPELEFVEPEPVAEEPEPEYVEPEAEPVAEEPEAEPESREPEPRRPARELDPAPWLAFAAESPLTEAEPEPEVEIVPEPVAEGPELVEEPEPVAEEPEFVEPEPVAPEPVAPEPEPETVEPEPEPVAAEPEPVAAEHEPEPEPHPIPEPITPAATQAAAPPPPPEPPAPDYGYTRRRGGLLPAAERMLRAALDATAAANERRERDYQTRMARPTPSAFPGAATPTPAAAAPAPDTTSEEEERVRQERQERHRREADLERRLVASGLTPGRAAGLVGAAISRRGPFSAGGSLIDDVAAMIATSLPTPVALPQEHGAVAVVGAGGAGKTRSVAALAAAQARAGALVSVASLGTPGREDELGALLHGEAVNIIPAMRTRATARAVSSARERGLVIIDTAAAAPRDDSTIDVMAEALHSFGLDAIYLAVPATLSSAAAVRLVDSFSAFDLTGMVATHVDETDELGRIAELAMQTGIPLAYTLNGFALQEAVESADPQHIAAELLR